MKIHCTATFLDGRDRFEMGDVRTVDTDRGAYFVANGWATADDQPSSDPSDDVSLTIANGKHGQEARHG